MIQHKNNMSDEEGSEISQSNNEKIRSLSDAEKYCLELIQEFLVHYEFERTVATLHEECLDRGLVASAHITKEIAQQISDAFNNKYGSKFFHLWETLMPETVQQTIEYKKLTFYLHVHFAILPMRDRLGSVDTNKDEEFFIEIDDGIETFVLIKDDSLNDTEEDDGSRVASQDRELSVVEEEGTDDGTDSSSTTDQESPAEEPPAKRTGNGMDDLRMFLETKGGELSSEPDLLPYFALPLVSNPTSHPSFQELFMDNWVERVSQNLRGFLKVHVVPSAANGKAPRLIQLVRSDPRQLNRRFQRLHRDHHQLIGLASELTNTLEKSVQGQTVDLKVTLDKCAQLYPELFSQHAKPQIFDLDYQKIKHHLSTASVKTRLLLLQALRWRITRSPAIDRRLVLHHYVRHDVLAFNPSLNSPSPDILSSLLMPDKASTPHPLQQAVARLVNTLASLRSGRDYLTSNLKLLDSLIPCLMEKKAGRIDGYTSDMLLAALQKLSLRHKLRLGMIEAGLVEWLVTRLSLENISTYTLEYGCALLMNLCLHNEAKDRCVPLAEQVLQLLARHLGARLPYVNGTLYSLLADKRINAEARRMGLSTVLEHHLKNTDGEMHKQLEYILKLHHAGATEQAEQRADEDENDDTEEMDLLEDELDASDPVPSELNGEDLLYQQYRLVFPSYPQGVVHRVPSAQPLVRPSTPKAHKARSPLPAQDKKLPPVAECPTAVEKPKVDADPKIPDEPSTNVTPCKDGEEYTKAFVSRPRISRTPT